MRDSVRVMGLEQIGERVLHVQWRRAAQAQYAVSLGRVPVLPNVSVFEEPGNLEFYVKLPNL